jgi:hypothetical protein
LLRWSWETTLFFVYASCSEHLALIQVVHNMPVLAGTDLHCARFKIGVMEHSSNAGVDRRAQGILFNLFGHLMKIQ